ncbi:MAG: hypothetical protein EA396_01600 [Anaerolineaceae bacterium]|nr:MAG: hypothetical protein EA396_01600 [Anaerolineaceae bacterium]
MGNREPNPARYFAGLILLIGMMASGVGAALAVAGRHALSVQICAGAVVLAVLILFFGGLIVGKNRPPDDD